MLLSKGATRQELEHSARKEQGLRNNNRIQNSYLVLQQHQRTMQYIKASGSALCLFSADPAVHNAFNAQHPRFRAIPSAYSELKRRSNSGLQLAPSDRGRFPAPPLIRL